jgi:hypothetical protein
VIPPFAILIQLSTPSPTQGGAALENPEKVLEPRELIENKVPISPA